MIDVLFAACIGHAEQHMIIQSGIALAQIVATDDIVLLQMMVQALRWHGQLDDKLIEEGTAESRLVAGDGGNLSEGVMALCRHSSASSRKPCLPSAAR